MALESVTYYYRAWYHTSRGWRLWCETRDPDDPYLAPTPDVAAEMRFDRQTITYAPVSTIDPWEPSPDLIAAGHPSTWEDDED